MKNGFAELGSVADFINGVAFKPEDWGDKGTRIIRIQNLTDSSKPYNLTTRNVDERYHVRPGDLLVSWSATLGVFKWPGPDVGLLNQHIFRVLPNRLRIEQRYLRHSLEIALTQMQRHLHGATMQHVNRGEFLGTHVYLPPLPEQRRIADVLDRAEALRAKRRAALAQLDTLTQAIFLDMFGDPKANPRGWPIRELQEVVRRGTIVTYGIVQAGEEYPGGVPYIRTGDIVAGEIVIDGLRRTDPGIAAKFERSRVDAGDIVMSIRATVGTTALVPESLAGANLTQGTGKISPGGDTHRLYLLNVLRAEGTQHWIARQIKGATFREITLGRLRELPLPVPPLVLQQEFAHRVAAVEKLKSAHRASLAQMDSLFAALQHRAFRGEL